jgi:hypothetical protein
MSNRHSRQLSGQASCLGSLKCNTQEVTNSKEAFFERCPLILIAVLATVLPVIGVNLHLPQSQAGRISQMGSLCPQRRQNFINAVQLDSLVIGAASDVRLRRSFGVDGYQQFQVINAV